MKPVRESDLTDAVAEFGAEALIDRAHLRARYRRLAFEHHPDRNGGSPSSFARFKRIHRAYQLLDESLRARGDVRGEVRGETCARCRSRPAVRHGLDRNPYCRDCLVYFGARRLLPAPPTVIVSCAFCIAAHVAALIMLACLVLTGQPAYGTGALASAGAGIVFLFVSALIVTSRVYSPRRSG